MAHGLNPDDASDAQKTAPNGYTYLENYLNAPTQCDSQHELNHLALGSLATPKTKTGSYYGG